eukprot:scaffold10059_cov123-Isochrysis_galbana.AAC.6
MTIESAAGSPAALVAAPRSCWSAPTRRVRWKKRAEPRLWQPWQPVLPAASAPGLRAERYIRRSRGPTRTSFE